MAFDNVDVNSLKNALISCKNSINNSKTDEILANISSSQVWQSESKNKLTKALEILGKERYKELESLLDKYLNVVNDLEEYKRIEKENISLSSQYSSLSKQLYYTDYYTETSYDADGNEITNRKSKIVKNYYVQNQMNGINQIINSNNSKLESLELKIKNSI